MAQNSHPRLYDDSPPTYEAATGAAPLTNELLLSVSDIVVHNERAPLISISAGRPNNTVRPSVEIENTLDDLIRRRAHHQATIDTRHEEIYRFQTYKDILALILAAITTAITLLIIIYAQIHRQPCVGDKCLPTYEEATGSAPRRPSSSAPVFTCQRLPRDATTALANLRCPCGNQVAAPHDPSVSPRNEASDDIFLGNSEKYGYARAVTALLACMALIVIFTGLFIFCTIHFLKFR